MKIYTKYTAVKRSNQIGFLMMTGGLLLAPLIVGWFGNPYHLFILTLVLIMAIVAQAYNVLLGSTGLLSFGHAAFFGIGAYTGALLIANTGIRSLIVIISLALLLSTAVAMVFAAISLRSSDIYYSLLTLALAQMLFVVAEQSFDITGGSQGMRFNRPTFLTRSFEDVTLMQFVGEFYYFFVLVIFVASTIILWTVMNSSLGLVLNSIRENQERAIASGLPVSRYKWYATVISGAFTGLAGVLFALLSGFIAPSETLHWTLSGEILFMTLLGGAVSSAGPIIGAATFVLLDEIAFGAFGQYSNILLGVVFLLLIVTVRDRGLVGAVMILKERLWSDANAQEGGSVDEQ